MNSYRNDNSRPDLDPGASQTAHMLNEVAGQIQPDPTFASNLERRLISTYSGRNATSHLSFKRLAPALIWVLVIGLMAVVLDWAIRSLAPEPVPAARSTSGPTLSVPMPPVDQGTPLPSGESYDWHGTTLYLAAALPDAPSEAGVYRAQLAQHATAEDAMALAQRFGIQGNIYVTSGEAPDEKDYLITDGKRSLSVDSSQYFTYTADIVRAYNNLGTITNPDAESIIRSFLESLGFTFPFRVEWSDFRSAYVIEPLSPENTPLRYERDTAPMMVATLDTNGQVSTVRASLMDLDSQPVGQYGILGANEALQELLDPARVSGVIEAMNSSPAPIHQWRRIYPLDQTLTIYGRVSSTPAVQPGTPAFVQIDGIPVVGQVGGLDAISGPSYVEATGRFVSENGIERFAVDSWRISDLIEDGLIGILERGDGRTTLTAEDGAQFVLPDVPDDLPMPFEKAFVIGTKVGKTFQWKLIDDRFTSGGGGGGGGGGGSSGFYKLNLTGTPVPFPSATATSAAAAQSPAGKGQYTVQAGDTLGSIASIHGTSIDALMQANNIADPDTLSIGQTLIIPGPATLQVDGLRGMLIVTITRQPDGSESVAYGFIANASSDPGGYMNLEGDNLQELLAYNNRPVDIWGTLLPPNDKGIRDVKVNRFEIPFPDIQFQILHGTQKIIDVSGQPATLFTTQDGKTYIQLLQDATTGISLIGNAGDQVEIECLAIPSETAGGYPALRIFSGSLAINPKNGQPMELTITADKPESFEAAPVGNLGAPPTATIEKIELVHFMSNPRYAPRTDEAQPLYFQPVWRFYGHYSSGDEFEILIQALREEYLLPEVEPALQPG